MAQYRVYTAEKITSFFVISMAEQQKVFRVNANLHFYSIPKGKTPFEKRRRDDWIRAIRRKNWPDEQISKARICSEHFVSGINLLFISHLKAYGI